MGLISSLNIGLDQAIGKYIARNDDDDVWIDKRKLERQINFLEENLEYALVGGNGYHVDERGRIILQRKVPITDEVIIVDNGSKGNDADVLEEKYKDYIRVIRNKKNLGFAEGNNMALRQVLKEGKSGYVLLLNNDTIVDPDFLTESLRVAESDPKIGIVGSRIYCYEKKNKKNIIWSTGERINWWIGKLSPNSLEDLDISNYSLESNDLISGCSMLIRKSVINKVGYLDKNFFCQWEDMDYCVRVRRADFIINYCPKSLVWHKGSQSSLIKKRNLLALYYNWRNMFYFMSKNANFVQELTFTIYIFLFYLPFIRIPGSILRYKSYREIKTFFRAYLDYRKGKMGFQLIK